ncbi:thioredoxin reductase (NADPH) [Alkalithermobacter thermoalcaliphilus JW-YL-7 = DSM 7308]|uniref:Thioredoxin reductase (NADPH) n=1 Tax=Alkalithermobacter thermoalcaliphilus JW-YL-7 = DSM 7308 TaxID=1121328 RepID=A0A150FQM4_CLOPD|nr:Thioredoxin-disulfide reductase [[Clostridium] paradoxum JW-YL-7 = DSM 7308]SHK77809.1 thioredoxin reductase (NADPH) [[Clostridium] paradoxum JW-YL-7 = DSM 7308]
MRYDIAIIGSGPAGLSAAINAKVRNKNIILFGSSNLSDKIVRAPVIDNYLGIYNVNGEGLKNAFRSHIESMDIKINEERATNVYAMGEYFVVAANDKMYEATTVILATGIEYTKPIKGEEEFLGKGVGYCATCDASLYRGKKVAIIGYNVEAEQEANFLVEIASNVYYIPIYKGNYSLDKNIQIIKDTPLEVKGKEYVDRLVLKKSEIDVDGVFFIKDSISPKYLVPGLEMEKGHIKVDKNMHTNIKGCFAAGDCTGKPYQYLKAAGEGQIAALSAVSYLDTKKNN